MSNDNLFDLYVYAYERFTNGRIFPFSFWIGSYKFRHDDKRDVSEMRIYERATTRLERAR